ncbi:MAG: phage baseplate upper protein [Youngiibacter sp.]|nr:phage baseplate upper protein [Youngiibacter sp.]
MAINLRDSYTKVTWDLGSKRLDFQPWGKTEDTGRGIVVTVAQNGVPITPSTEVVRMSYIKPDGTDGYIDAVLVDGKYYIEDMSQAFAVSGLVSADFQIQVGTEFLRSATFTIVVHPSQLSGTIVSSNDYTALQEALQDVVDLKQALNKTAVTSSHQFADNTARDAYFVAHPTELTDLLFIKVGTAYQQYIDSAWQDASPILTVIPNADTMSIADAGSHFTGTTVEAALQETGTSLAAITNQFTSDLAAIDNRVDDIITTPVEVGEIIAQEIIDGRQGEGSIGANFTKVKTDAAQNTLFSNQVDFVQFVKDYSHKYTKMKFVKVSETAWRVLLNDEMKGITYQFKKDYQDDFIKLDAGYCGAGDTQIDKDYADVGRLTGTWNTATGNFYTTVVGATFTLGCMGSKIILYGLAEPRGGMWEIVVDGDTDNKVNVSCYANPQANYAAVIAENLDPAVEHTVVGTYIGDDPEHAPSSNPSRGYITVNTGLATGTVTGYEKSATIINTILGAGSNKEFAFAVSKNAQSNWIPEHDGVGSAFDVTPARFYIDGEYTDVGSMPLNTPIDITTFELRQNVLGQVVGVGDVLDIESIHRIDKSGLLTFNGKAKALTDVSVTAYPLMLPALAADAKEFITGIMGSKVSLSDESYTYFDAEGDNVFSGVIISSTLKNIAGAGTLKFPTKTYRIGKDNKPVPGQDLFLWNRSTTPKLYWQSMSANPMVLGDYYAWGFDLIIADVDDIYNLIKS